MENTLLNPNTNNREHLKPHRNRYTKQLSVANNIYELKGIVLDILNDLAGLTDFSFVRSIENALTNPLITNPRDQLDIYFRNRYQDDDFMVEYAAQDSNQPVFASQVYEIATRAHIATRTFKRNEEIMKLNRQYGFYDYFCMRQDSIVKRKGKPIRILYAVTQRYVEPFELRKIISPAYNELIALCEAIDYTTAINFPELLSEEENLSIEDIQLGKLEKSYLKEIGELRKKPKQIAKEYNVSVGSVYQALDRARRKLKAKTNFEAYAEARKFGLF